MVRFPVSRSARRWRPHTVSHKGQTSAKLAAKNWRAPSSSPSLCNESVKTREAINTPDFCLRSAAVAPGR